MSVTVKKFDGKPEDYPITPEDRGKTVWEFLKEKVGLDAVEEDTLVLDGPTGQDVKDKEISQFDGKKLFINIKSGT